MSPILARKDVRQALQASTRSLDEQRAGGLLTREERSKLVDLLLILPVDSLQMRNIFTVGLSTGLVQLSQVPAENFQALVEMYDSPGARLADGTWPILKVIANAIGLAQGTTLEQELRQLLDGVLARTRRDKRPGLRALVAEELEWLQKLEATLAIRPDPGIARLRRINWSSRLKNEIVPALQQIQADDEMFHGWDPILAPSWIQIAREIANAASIALNRCREEVARLVPDTTPGMYQHSLERTLQSAREAVSNVELSVSVLA